MDIPILKYIDVLIGLSLVMVLVSTVVLAVTQFMLNSTFARARHLARGLTRLIVNVDPGALREHAGYVSQLLLRHPLIGRQTMLTPIRKWWTSIRKLQNTGEVLPPISPGSVAQREEVAFLLIELAAGEGPLMDPTDQGTTPERVQRAQQAIARALRATGIEDPAATLRAIRLKAVENERADPALPAHRWRSDAVAACATSDFIGKLHDSFDSTMARVTDAFGAESQLWVAVASLIIVVAVSPTRQCSPLLNAVSGSNRFCPSCM